MSLKNFKNIPPFVERWGLFAGWMAGLIIISVLLWGFTQPVRNTRLLNSVNRILKSLNEETRLETPLSSWGMPGRAAQTGTWFTTASSGDWAVVFTIPSGGVFCPVLACISRDGTVASFIPLSVHAEAVFQRLPPGQLRIYVRRIETSYAVLSRVREDKHE